MNAFKPDLFSDPHPRFTAVDASSSRRLLHFLEREYPDCGPFLHIEKCVELGTNSRNFRVLGKTRNFILKEMVVANAIAQVTVSFSERLREGAVPVPEVFRNRDGRLVSRQYERTYYLMEDIGGHFFSGAGDEIEVVSKLLARLWKLRNLSPIDPLIPTLPLLGSEDLETARQFERRLTDAELLLGEADGRLLRVNWPNIRRRVEESAEWLAATPPEQGVMHIDLHPHNLMLRSDRSQAVALDLDSFQCCAPAVALSFGVYKLLRQASIHRVVSREEILRGVEDWPSDLAALGMSEVLRRLLLILRLNLVGDRRWNKVLRIQLNSIAEVDVVLGA